MSLRVKNHIVLDVKDERKTVTITVDGKPVQAKEGEPILSSLLAAGIKINRYTRRFHEPRGLFCAIGQCTDCVMVVNGKPNVRTCVTPVQEGMVVETQDGLEQKGGHK
ncbi:MAG TPA: dehydrogenase [Ruminococcaceae bacterium]|jgi:predicted molibdopterin-dependent oxidoreductase YjgC|nr:(2Fe-2S)-binding protein [Oscillospiraceae bacterium]HCC01295.1 dehydrogenase [Oscillospiraceae bacterium]HCM24073.1 dehydrogenase [Oscillospiraceae bacterium]